VMRDLLIGVGFRVQLLEYWDSVGSFHAMDWKWTDGPITRSRRYDLRNSDGSTTYTSLIVDAIKD
jgi:predicted SAM-dependent methyltransferase